MELTWGEDEFGVGTPLCCVRIIFGSIGRLVGSGFIPVVGNGYKKTSALAEVFRCTRYGIRTHDFKNENLASWTS